MWYDSIKRLFWRFLSKQVAYQRKKAKRTHVSSLWRINRKRRPKNHLLFGKKTPTKISVCSEDRLKAATAEGAAYFADKSKFATAKSDASSRINQKMTARAMRRNQRKNRINVN